MKAKAIPVSLLTSCFVFFLAAGLRSAVGQDSGITAQTALGILETRFGTSRAGWVVELRGFRGQDQPREWEVFAYDADTPYLVRKFQVGEGDATNEGPADDFFPLHSPTGYLTRAEIQLDSNAAFTIAEAAARQARMGFDRLNYYLRCREYSREPVWRLELVDVDERIVGKVYLSAETGEVLRTVWIYRGDRGREDGSPLVIDSSAPAGTTPAMIGAGETGVVPVPGGAMPPATDGIAPPPLPDAEEAAPAAGAGAPPMPSIPALDETPLVPGGTLPKPPPPPSPELEPKPEADSPVAPVPSPPAGTTDQFDTRIPPPATPDQN